MGNTKYLLNGFDVDYIFPCLYFDPVYRKENNIKTLLLGPTKPQHDLEGCYIFFDFCDNEFSCFWVGKSKTLRNRITNHWGNYYRGHVKNTIEEWFTCRSDNLDFYPMVAIIISVGVSSSYLRDLETKLIYSFSPVYNSV